MKLLKKSSKQEERKTLANTTARLICTVMTFVFLLLIISVSYMAGSSLFSATTSNLRSIAQANGVQIQEYLNICETTAAGLSEQIINLMDEESTLSPSSLKIMVKEASEVYGDLHINSVKKGLEEYIIYTAKSAVANNDAVIGIGIMFEPYRFTEDRESYALYFTEDNGEIAVSDVGTYDEFSANNYYQVAVGKTETVFTQPYTYKDMWMITGATPIIMNGEMIGVVNVDLNMSVFDGLSISDSKYPSMKTAIISAGGTIDFDSMNTDNISKNVSEVFFRDQNDLDLVMSNVSNGSSFDHKSYSVEDKTNVYGYYYPLRAGSEMWTTVTMASSRDVLVNAFLTIALLILICVISLFIIAYITLRTLRIKLAPIQDVVDAAGSMASGNLDISLRMHRGDEIGVLSESFMATGSSLKNMIEDISQVLDSIANNNFTVNTAVIYQGDFARIKTSFDKITANLNSTMHNIRVSTGRVSLGADQMAQTASALATDASAQALSIEKLQDSIKEATVMVEKNATHTNEANSLILDVGHEVETSNRKMEQMIEAITEITETSKHIELIIQNIENIASQTNLLSLNAAIEAARAGESGKGFAVVAEEIRELANQSAGAAQNTRKLIEESIRAVDNGTSIAADTENSMLLLVDKIKNIIVNIENISAASNGQKDAILEIERSVVQISDVVQNNSGSAQEASATSEVLKLQAETLAGLLSEFTLNDEISK